MDHPCYDFEAGEILNINKPERMTSFQVVKRIRNFLKIKKVGHAGTLDPFATGVLLVLTGGATKKSQWLAQQEKEYVAGIEFGKETDTGDRDGRVIEERPLLEKPEKEEIVKTLSHFVGEIEQIPPKYSAIKYKGKPLYKYARRGIEVEVHPRTVQIKRIDLLDLSWPLARIGVVCSKGTYIRSLARDIGRKLHTLAYLTSLTRTRVGNYHIEESYTLDEFFQICGRLKGA